MKVHTIEIAAAIEGELKKFLSDWGGGYAMRFTRFIDLGGKQTDLYVYPAAKDAGPWMVIRIKSVFRTDQGECIQYFVDIPKSDRSMDEVMVSPEVWKLPALADRILNFARNDMLAVVGEGGGGALESGGPALEEGRANASSSESGSDALSEDEEDEYENIDTSGILAGDGDAGASMDFNPEDVIASANQGGGEEDMDPSELLKQLGAEADQEEEGSEDDDAN